MTGAGLSGRSGAAGLRHFSRYPRRDRQASAGSQSHGSHTIARWPQEAGALVARPSLAGLCGQTAGYLRC